MRRANGASVLVVDDTPENLRLLAQALSGAGFKVRAAPSGKAALDMAFEAPPELVLLDISMPEMDGYQVCEALCADPELARVPVLFISAMNDPDAKLQAFRRGGRDFVTKPFNVDEVVARVSTHVELRRLEAALEQHNAWLEQRVTEQVREISDSQVATIVALAKLSESRDDDTGMHVERIGRLATLLAGAARGRPGCQALDDRLLRVIGHAASLHDIGKVGVPDAVLLKRGRLDAAELALMRAHPAIGARTLEAVLRSYPQNELIQVGADIARSHHERWDGAGYPAGLAGSSIPLAARVVAVVDVYDALRSARPYKAAQSHQAAAQIVMESSGTHFDPELVAAFMAVEWDIEATWQAMQGQG